MAIKTKTEFVRARIEPAIKHEAEEILHKLGLNQTEAIRFFYKQIILNQGLPFELKIPNKTTLTAINQAENNINTIKCVNSTDLFDKLGL